MDPVDGDSAAAFLRRARALFRGDPADGVDLCRTEREGREAPSGPSRVPARRCDLALRGGEFETALAQAEKVLAACDAEADNELAKSCLNLLGLCHWQLSRHDEARDCFLRDWRMMTYPGLAVLVVGTGFGLIGDGLAQALRPRG